VCENFLYTGKAFGQWSTAYAQEILPTTGLNGAMVNNVISQEDAAAIIKTERIDGRATAMIPHGFIT